MTPGTCLETVKKCIRNLSQTDNNMTEISISNLWSVCLASYYHINPLGNHILPRILTVLAKIYSRRVPCYIMV